MNYGLPHFTTTLAQFKLGQRGDTPTVSTLPAPPPLEHYLFESPWLPAVVLVFAAIVATWALNRRARAKQGALVGVGLLVLAGAVVLTAQMVTTTRESLIARTRELVAYTAKADTTALSDLLGGDVLLRAYFFQEPMPKDVLLGRVERYMGREYPVESHKVDSASAVIDGRNAARTQVHVVVHNPSATMYNVPVGSWWRIEWRLDKDGEWRVTGLECLQLDVVAAGQTVSP
jgi:hypothetical protein